MKKPGEKLAKDIDRQRRKNGGGGHFNMFEGAGTVSGHPVTPKAKLKHRITKDLNT